MPFTTSAKTIKNVAYSIALLLTILATFPSCFPPTKNIPEISSIDSIEKAKTFFEHATDNDLFVFDVDEVIFEPTEPLLQTRFFENPSFKDLIDEFHTFAKTKKDSEKYIDLIASKFLVNTPIQPVEKTLIDNILALQKRNIRVIVLTAIGGGRFGVIERWEEWRYQQLLSMGLDFSTSFAQQQIGFDELQKSDCTIHRGTGFHPAVFYKGIVCSSCFSKGIVLADFLKKVGWRPATVYFFDDRSKNVESVAQEMEKMGIMCHAFVYQAAALQSSREELSIETLRFLIKLIEETSEFVSYGHAYKMLMHQGNHIINHITSARAAIKKETQPPA